MDKSPFSQEYQAFLRLLRELRVEAGLTQDDVASVIQETQSFVSKCERGERRIDIVELWYFCKAIGISLSDLTGRLDAIFEQEHSNHVA